MSRRNSKYKKTIAKSGQQQSNVSNVENEVESFDFAKLNSTAGLSGLMSLYNNPLWRNEILKQLTSTPQKYKRDDIAKLIENPVHNEKALKDIAQYLMNNSLHFKRIVHYFASILDFRHYLRPVGVDSTSATSKSFLSSKKKAYAWLEKFNVKHEFGKIMETVILEDAGFYYLRESKDKVTLQRMPSDYCKIVDETDLGYQYAFNMVYFLRPGVSFNAFAPEFQDYYDEFLAGSKNNQFYWKDLPPEKAFVFKWDENFAGVIPVLLGLYLDTVEIDEFKRLLKSKTMLDNWKILFQKMPMKAEKDSKKNEFLIDATMAGNFHLNIKKELPEGVSVITSPMDVTGIDLNSAENKNSIVGVGEAQFYSSAGVPALIFGGATSSSAGLAFSLTVDAAFVSKMYHQFARFLNFALSQATGTYKFKAIFPDGTIFNKDTEYKKALEMAQSGFPVTVVACHAGYDPNDLEQLMFLEEATGIKDRLRPLLTAHTQSGDGGRPKSPDETLSTSGVIARDNGTNSVD